MRRAFQRPLLATGLGLATSLVLAWVLAVLVHLPPGTRGGAHHAAAARNRTAAEGDGGYIIVARWSRPGAVLWRSSISVHNSLATLMTEPTPEPPEALVPGWARAAVLPWVTGDAPWPSGNTVSDGRVVAARGWPVPALRCSYVEVNFRATAPYRDIEVRGGIPVPVAPPATPAFTEPAPPMALPLVPIASGLLVDTGVFAACWWALMFVPGMVRRGVRRRRGRCPRCGYDLRHDLSAGCPECGWGR